MANNELTSFICVENASGTALSDTAELYSAMYMGLGVPANEDSPTYNWREALHGGWSLFPNDHIKNGSRAMLDHWSTEPDQEQLGRRRMVGYNFSAITSWHLPSTECVLTMNEPSIIANAGDIRVWNLDNPLYRAINYTLPTVQSVNRVGIGIGLVLTHEMGLTFQTSQGYGSYIHMLATATAAQTSLIFYQTNLNLSMWAGYNTSRDDVSSTLTMQSAIYMATNDIARYTGVAAMIRSWPRWDENMIFEYFGLDPFTEVNWLSYSPLPHHYVQQWSTKINYITDEAPKDQTYIRHRNNNHLCLMFDSKTLQYRSLSSATIDADRYFPMVLIREPDAAVQHLIAWVEQWSYISNISSGSQNKQDQSFLESNELVISLVDNGLEYAPGVKGYVIGSNYVHSTEAVEVLNLSDIVWPDPIDQKTIIQAAKNYPAYPALAALGGFITGGPVAATVAGGTSLAKAVMEELTKTMPEAHTVVQHKPTLAAVALPTAQTPQPAKIFL